MKLHAIKNYITHSNEDFRSADRIVDFQSLTLGGKHVNQIFTRPKGNKPH